MRVANLMSTNVRSVAADQPLSAAVELMWECDCGVVPVRAPDTDRVVGMITDRDICIATWSRAAAPAALLVRDAMSSALHCCSPNDPLAVAESVMRTHKVRRLPVVDAEQRLVGILSLADIARGIRAPQYRTDPDLAADQFALTVSLICEERRARSAA
jgi:CBS domain-containing protein